MASQHRKHRGYASQRIAAEWFNEHGWVLAYATGAGESGDDIRRLPFHVEVKAQKSKDYTGWVRQVRNRVEDNLPYFVISRPDGYGPKSVGQWLCITDLETMTELLKDAGYTEDKK